MMFGKTLSKQMLKKSTAPLAIGAGIYGFGKGVGSQDVSANAYEFLTGDPEMDNYVLGRDAGLRQLMFPLPGSPIRGMGSEVATGTLTGAGVGAATGAGLGYGAARLSRRMGRGAMASGLIGAMVGFTTGVPLTGVGAYQGLKSSSRGYINSTTMPDALRARNYNNNLPMVDGSLVLGAYNTRMGGY